MTWPKPHIAYIAVIDPLRLNEGLWYRNSGPENPVIIFVHGRASNNLACWLNESLPVAVYWPDLVVSEPSLAHWDVYLAGYSADDGSGTGIADCADQLFRRLSDDQAKPLERPAIVFVAHSLGGIVTRRILSERYERFKQRDVHLMLLASPSTGAGFPSWLATPMLALLGMIRDRTLTKQLTVRLDVVRDLDRNFKRLQDPADDRHLPKLTGIERSESASLFGTPILGRIVEPLSAERYFADPAQLANETHVTICKPSSRYGPVHLLLVKACEKHAGPSSNGRTPLTLQSLLAELQDRFGFRYERGDSVALPDSAVYWPVRLREPTPIHAQQSFAAAALTKLGLRVELWLDDLGNQKYPPHSFEQRVRRWFLAVGGVDSLLTVKTLSSQLLAHEAMESAWALTRQWLGDTAQPLREVLRLSKLHASSIGNADLLEQLLARRPRRLLTPPLVWLGLRQMAQSSERVATLGGLDETELWQTWRSLGIDQGIAVAHLYGAALTEGSEGSRRNVHMRSSGLNWHSVDDIAAAIGAADPPAGLPEPGSLPAWCLEQCVFLPQYVEGRHPEIEIDGRIYRSSPEVWNLPPALRRRGLARALEARLL